MSDQSLVSTASLAEQLDDPALRIFDCSVQLSIKPTGGYQSESGRALWLDGHIPGAGFIDLLEELSDTSQKLPFMMPGEAQFVGAMSGYGVGPDNRVVLYNRGPGWWAMRVWWMLREFGFDNAAVLDGGWNKWKAEGRLVTSGEEQYPPAQFVAGPHREIFVGPAEVLQAIDESETVILNALTSASHRGETKAYARLGHIAGSLNVPAPGLFLEDQAYIDETALRSAFEHSRALEAGRVINYCGGGISAAADAFALHLLGHSGVQIYDGSLSEWARDPELPMETGD